MFRTILIASMALALGVCAGNQTSRTNPSTSKFFDSKFIGACEDVLCPSHRPSKKPKGKESPRCPMHGTDYQKIGYSTLNKHRHNPQTAPKFLESSAWVQAGHHTGGRRNEMIYLTTSFILDTDSTTRSDKEKFDDGTPGTAWQGCALFFKELSPNVRLLGSDSATAKGDCSMSLNE